MKNTVIDFSQYSDSDLDLLIRGLGSIDVTDGAPEAIGEFLMGELKGGRIDRNDLNNQLHAKLEEKKQECIQQSEDIAILKAKLISLRRDRKSNQQEQPKQEAVRQD
jgi:hypothetical protein